MRRLVLTENITVDGIISPMEGWFDPTDQDEEVAAATREHSAASDALVLGRVTYEQFAGYWPAQIDVDTTGVSAYLDGVAKYVASSTLERADWANTTILRGPIEDELAALKAAEGKDITITGSATLVTALVPSGLIDIVRLWVYPAVQGHGTRLFPDGFAARMTLESSRVFAGGIQLVEYRLGT